MKRRTFIQHTSLAAGMIAATPLLAQCATTEDHDFPLIDLHVHRAENFGMEQIITAAKAKNIAIEINDMSHTPHEQFILMAKEQGLKFSFGSDSRNYNVGRLVYCKGIAKKCNLKKEDFFIPVSRA